MGTSGASGGIYFSTFIVRVLERVGENSVDLGRWRWISGRIKWESKTRQRASIESTLINFFLIIHVIVKFYKLSYCRKRTNKMILISLILIIILFLPEFI